MNPLGFVVMTVGPGRLFSDIKHCVQVSESGCHRPHVAGIHGRSNDGSYSLVLAGGYEDDQVHRLSSIFFLCYMCP